MDCFLSECSYQTFYMESYIIQCIQPASSSIPIYYRHRRFTAGGGIHQESRCCFCTSWLNEQQSALISLINCTRIYRQVEGTAATHTTFKTPEHLDTCWEALHYSSWSKHATTTGHKPDFCIFCVEQTVQWLWTHGLLARQKPKQQFRQTDRQTPLVRLDCMEHGDSVAVLHHWPWSVLNTAKLSSMQTYCNSASSLRAGPMMRWP